MTGGAAVSGGCLGPGLRPPDPDGLGPGTPGLAGRPPVSTRTEGAVDHAVRREEPLGLPGCLEPLHPPLSSPARPMRVLRAIAEVAAAPLSDLGQELALCPAVALQPLGEQPAWLVSEACEQAPEEPPGCTPVPSILNQDVQHRAVLVHRAPERVEHALDAQKHRIEVPGVARLRPAPAQLSGERRADLSAPAPEALRRAGDASPREDQFDIPQAQAEHRRQPDRVADALRRDAVSRRGGGVWCDPVSFAQPAPSSYCHSTGQCLRKMSMVSARRIMA